MKHAQEISEQTVMRQSNAFITKHRLDFEVADWEPLPGFMPATNFMRFRVGTCEGLWACTSTSYDILAIDNKAPGNGHFEDVLQWFESSCMRDKKDLKILEIMNKPFMKHLIKKRGFKKLGNNNVIMKF